MFNNDVVIDISVSVIVIIDKYFESNKDFINTMKVNKKYHDLTQMYHFNPINDYDLLILKHNISTVIIMLIKRVCIKYIYLYPVDYEIIYKNKKENDIKIIELKYYMKFISTHHQNIITKIFHIMKFLKVVYLFIIQMIHLK